MEYSRVWEAWYWPSLVEHRRKDRDLLGRELTVCKAALTDDGREDGVHWEFNVCERLLRDGRVIGLWVEVADDAWQAFHEAAPFFARLRELHRDGLEHGEVTLEQIADICAALGYYDDTPRERRE